MGNLASPNLVLVRATQASPTALPGAGAYDTLAAATPIGVFGASDLALFCDYTRGSTGGAFALQIWESFDGTTYYQRTILDGTSLASGAVNGFPFSIKPPVTASASVQQLSFVIDARRVKFLKILAAEYGVTATPGTLVVTAGLGL